MSKFGKRLLRSVGIELRPCAPVPLFRKSVHYLHIGKTAGTQIGHVIAQVNSAQNGLAIIKNGHGTTLKSLPQDAAYFFSVRNPIARFRSGFYSRKRMGRPRLNNPWSPSEAQVFNEFEDANDLAEALFRSDARGQKAVSAMMTIGHIGNLQIDWFKKAGDIFMLRPPVWIIRQEHLEADIKILLQRLGIQKTVTLTSDPKMAHVNDYAGIPRLSDQAVTNLQQWYCADIQFYAHLEAWMAENQVRSGVPAFAHQGTGDDNGLASNPNRAIKL